MARSVVEYKDFSGGEYGRLGAWRAPKNAWTGSNMLVYRTGELGVRPGLKKLTVTTNVPEAELYFLASDGSGTVYTNSAGVRHVYTFNGAATGGTTAGTKINNALAVSDSINGWVRPGRGSRIYITTDLTQSYDVTSTASTALTGSPDGNLLALYGDRMVHADGATVSYSDAADFNSWPVDNFFLVGPTNTRITGLWAQRTHLLIGTTEGFYVLTGPPDTGTLRQVTTTEGPQANAPNTGLQIVQSAEAVAHDSRVLYVPELLNVPAWHDGVREAPVMHLEADARPCGAIALKRCRSQAFLSRPAGTTPVSGTVAHALVQSYGAWSYHNFGAASFTMNGMLATEIALVSSFERNRGLLLLADPPVGSAPTFYHLVLGQDSPGIEGQSYQKAGDDSTSQVSGSVTFPEWHSDTAQDVLVRTVVVDFRSWDTGGSNTNHFDLTVDALRRFDSTSPNSSATQSWNQTGSSSSASGTIQRQVFGFGDQGCGNGFQISLTNIRGVAIQRIQVVVDSVPPRFA
jgi:hypothetical protein